MRGRAVFLLLAMCGVMTACSAGSTSSAATPSPSPNTAGEVAAVKAAVTAFIEAYAKSEETGDARPVEALTVPGSKAYGNAGNFAASTISTGSGFKTTRLSIDQISWKIRSMSPSNASMSVAWQAFGYPVTYPADTPSGTYQASQIFSGTYQVQAVNGQWLVESFS